VGVLVPWANTAVEQELSGWGGDVVYHYARLVPTGRATALDDCFLRGLASAVPAALGQLDRLPLAGVLLACTSVGFSGMTDNLPAVVSAFDALLAELRRRRARRIVLATPYPEPLTLREVSAFAAAGVGVLDHASLGRDDDLGTVPAADVVNLLDRLDRSAVAEADAVVLSCTAWHTARLLGDIHRRHDRPVISSNLALAHCAARLTYPASRP
jgi:maleate isomerase